MGFLSQKCSLWTKTKANFGVFGFRSILFGANRFWAFFPHPQAVAHRFLTSSSTLSFFSPNFRIHPRTIAAALYRVPAPHGERNYRYPCRSHSPGGSSLSQLGDGRRGSAPGRLPDTALVHHLLTLVLAQRQRGPLQSDILRTDDQRTEVLFEYGSHVVAAAEEEGHLQAVLPRR